MRIIYDTWSCRGIIVTVRGRYGHLGHRITLWRRVRGVGGHRLDLRGVEVVYHAIDLLGNKVRACLRLSARLTGRGLALRRALLHPGDEGRSSRRRGHIARITRLRIVIALRAHIHLVRRVIVLLGVLGRLRLERSSVDSPFRNLR